MNYQRSITRYLFLLAVTILGLSTIFSKGQPVLSTGSGIANCGADVKLTCSQAGFDDTKGYQWFRSSNERITEVMNTGKDTSGTGRYSTVFSPDSFSLIITNAVLEDAGNYTCEYDFTESDAEPLRFECKPVDSGVEFQRNDQGMLRIQITNVYPETKNMTVACESEDKQTTYLQGNFRTATPNGDHFDITWTSADTMYDGSYTCFLTIVTLTTTNITKTGLTFESPEVMRSTSVYFKLTIILAVLLVLVVFLIVPILTFKLSQNRKIFPSACEIAVVPQGINYMLKWTTSSDQTNMLRYQIWKGKNDTSGSGWDLKADVCTTETCYTVESLNHNWRVIAEYHHTREIKFSRGKHSDDCILTWRGLNIDPYYVNANQIWRKKKTDNDSWELIDSVSNVDSSVRVDSGRYEYKVLALYKPIEDQKIKVKYDRQNDNCILTWGGLNIETIKSYQILRKRKPEDAKWELMDSVSNVNLSYRVGSRRCDYKVHASYETTEDQEIEVTSGTLPIKQHSAGSSTKVDTSINLTWSIPSTDDKTNIKNFNIMRTKDEDWEDVFSVSNSTNSYEIYNEEYIFEIRIISEKQTEEVKAIVPELERNDDEILLYWNPLLGGPGRVQEYVVMRKKIKSNWEKVGVVSNKEKSYTINSKSYKWKIRTVTEKVVEVPDLKIIAGAQITLTWSRPSPVDKSYIKSFNIMRTKDEHWEDVCSVSNIRDSYEIYNEEYTFEIHITPVEPNENHEPIAPELKRNDDELLLCWKPPQGDHVRVKEYVVMRKKAESCLEKVGVVSNKENSYTIYSKGYRWKIRTVTEDVDEIGVVKAIAGEPGIPEDFFLRHEGYTKKLTNLHISWKRPSDPGTSVIKYYHICTKESEDATGTCIWNLKKTVPAGVLRYTVEDWNADLPNGYIGVCAENEAGCGKFTFKQTRKDTASAPVTLSLIHTSKKLKLTWEPPAYSGHECFGSTKYIISTRKNDGEWTEWKYVDGTACVIAKESMLAGQVFSVAQTTLSGDGVGDCLDTVIQKEGQGTPPGKITHVTFQYYLRTHTVSWEPPVNCGSPKIEKYRIEITKITDETFKSTKKKIHRDYKGKYYDLMTIGSVIGINMQDRCKSTVPDIEAFVIDYKLSYETKELDTHHYLCSVCALNDDSCGPMTYAISQETLKKIEEVGNSDEV